MPDDVATVGSGFPRNGVHAPCFRILATSGSASMFSASSASRVPPPMIPSGSLSLLFCKCARQSTNVRSVQPASPYRARRAASNASKSGLQLPRNWYLLAMAASCLDSSMCGQGGLTGPLSFCFFASPTAVAGGGGVGAAGLAPLSSAAMVVRRASSASEPVRCRVTAAPATTASSATPPTSHRSRLRRSRSSPTSLCIPVGGTLFGKADVVAAGSGALRAVPKRIECTVMLSCPPRVLASSISAAVASSGDLISVISRISRSAT